MSKRNEREFLMTTMSSEAIRGRRGSTWARFLSPPTFMWVHTRISLDEFLVSGGSSGYHA